MQYIAVIFPTVGVAAIFYVVMRAIILADRRERAELAKLEAHEHPGGIDHESEHHQSAQ